MFLLVDKQNGSVYAIQSKSKGKVVQMFEDEDDAERYLGLLLANSLDSTEHHELEVTDVDEDTVNTCVPFIYILKVDAALQTTRCAHDPTGTAVELAWSTTVSKTKFN